MTAIDCPKGHRTVAMYFRLPRLTTLHPVEGWRYCVHCKKCYNVKECKIMNDSGRYLRYRYVIHRGKKEQDGSKPTNLEEFQQSENKA